MLLAVTPDSFIPEEHPIRRIKPIVESAAAERARLGGARLKVCSAHPEPQHAPDLRGSHDECGWKSGRSGGKASERRSIDASGTFQSSSCQPNVHMLQPVRAAIASAARQ